VGGVPDSCVPRSLVGSPGLSELGACLRAEWRTEEEAWARTAAQRWVSGRGIADVAREYAARGDHVVVDVGSRVFSGAVCAVGDDCIDLVVGRAVVSVHTALTDGRPLVAAPITIRRSSRALAGGLRVPPARPFRARLRELEGAGAHVRLGVYAPASEHTGRVVVGTDHVVVGETVVPAAWIAYVVAVSAVDR
jgi:hypothetical protein